MLQPTTIGEEQTHIHRALSMCNPDWSINRTKLKICTPKPNKNTTSKTISRGHITVSYSEGLSESVKNIAKKMTYKFISRLARA